MGDAPLVHHGKQENTKHRRAQWTVTAVPLLDRWTDCTAQPLSKSRLYMVSPRDNQWEWRMERWGGETHGEPMTITQASIIALS